MHSAAVQLATELSTLTKIVRIWVEKWQKLESATASKYARKISGKGNQIILV